MLLCLASDFDIMDVGAYLGSQEEMRKIESTLDLVPPVAVVVCTTPAIAKVV